MNGCIKISKLTKLTGWHIASTFLVGLLALLLSCALQANHSDGPSLKEIVDNPIKYNKVNLDGMILRRLDKDTYLVQDGTAVMQVSIPESLAPRGGFLPRNHISFEGKVDIEWDRSVVIDIDSLTFSF